MFLHESVIKINRKMRVIRWTARLSFIAISRTSENLPLTKIFMDLPERKDLMIA